MGLINPTKIDDPMLKRIERGIDAKVSPQLRKQYLQILVAGMKVIYHSEISKQIADKLKSSMDIKGDVSKGTANIIATIFNEVSRNMRPEQKTSFVAAAMPAGVTLMCQLLDYSEQIAGTKVTEDLIAETSQATSVELLRKFGIDESQVKSAIAAGQKKVGA